MIWWLLLGFGVVLVAMLILLGRYYDEMWFIPAFIVGVVLLVYGFSIAGIRATRHYDKVACHSFGAQSQRKVKFVDYTFWSWDCLTPTADGKWISTSNLREFGEQP